MAASSTEQPGAIQEPGSELAPRKFKASDLPLPSATRAAIESLAHSFKKQGAYDSIRKQVWEKFEASVWPLAHLSDTSELADTLAGLRSPSPEGHPRGRRARGRAQPAAAPQSRPKKGCRAHRWRTGAFWGLPKSRRCYRPINRRQRDRS